MLTILQVILGLCAVIFNRFAAETAVEFQMNVIGTSIPDPEKAKLWTSWAFAVAGVFLVTIALLGKLQPSAQGEGLSVSAAILGGIGALLFAAFLIFFQRWAVDSAAQQVAQLFGRSIPRDIFHYLLIVLAGGAFLCGATLIGTVIYRR
jgi:hypothetical protein